MISNSRIFESLRGKLEHLDSQKVEIYEFEMTKGHLLQRISDLELSVNLQVKESQSFVESSIVDTNENIRKLHDFMLQIKESTKSADVPFAKKSDTEETFQRLEKRIEVLTDTVMKNTIGLLQPIKNK